MGRVKARQFPGVFEAGMRGHQFPGQARAGVFDRQERHAQVDPDHILIVPVFVQVKGVADAARERVLSRPSPMELESVFP